MKKISFKINGTILRFLKVRHQDMTLFCFLHTHFSIRRVKRTLLHFDIQADTRYMCHRKYAVVIPIKDENGEVQDIIFNLVDPKTGKTLKNGDTRAVFRPEMGLCKNIGYQCSLLGHKSWSLKDKLSPDSNQPFTLNFFGLDKVLLPENSGKIIRIVDNMIIVMIMTALCPESLWIAPVGEEIGTNIIVPNLLKVIEGRNVRLYPKYGSFQKAKEVEYILNKQHFNIKTDSIVEQSYFEWTQEGATIATYALAMFCQGYPDERVISHLCLNDNSLL